MAEGTAEPGVKGRRRTLLPAEVVAKDDVVQARRSQLDRRPGAALAHICAYQTRPRCRQRQAPTQVLRQQLHRRQIQSTFCSSGCKPTAYCERRRSWRRTCGLHRTPLSASATTSRASDVGSVPAERIGVRKPLWSPSLQLLCVSWSESQASLKAVCMARIVSGSNVGCGPVIRRSSSSEPRVGLCRHGQSAFASPHVRQLSRKANALVAARQHRHGEKDTCLTGPQRMPVSSIRSSTA
jgi:hypothetical protein